jgi:hypothetical protein
MQGPIEQIDGQLVLLIPLDAGGADLAPFATGISEIVGDVLRVDIPDWIARKLNLTIGTIVEVDNANGKFNIRPVAGEGPPAHS